ncbi:MAG: SDR family NAD(P)-dependent oxidoreductase, partial [Ardenticatenaceae bacterium]
LRSPGEVQQALRLIQAEKGPVGALIHLLPLTAGKPFEETGLEEWRERMAMEVRGLFLLAQALQPQLESAAGAGGAALIALSGMGGAFASDAVGVPVVGAPPATPAFAPHHGAIAGFLKTLAREWPGIRVRALDVNPQESTAALAGYVSAELFTADRQVEVGYSNGRRVGLESVPAPLDAQRATFELGPESVVLVTGGARGITADVAQELAERYRPTLILVGRSPLPPAEEAPDTAGIAEPAALKAALIKRLQAQNDGRVTLAGVESAYGRLLKAREIRDNVAALERAGATVFYYPVDVRDEQAFGALIATLYESFGRLDGVIHGAGIIEDKLVKDKTPESFDRVFSTKVESAFVLSRHLRPDSLRFLVFFTSVAGRFGNPGQADYAAANEVLNKLAIYLDSQWPARVVAINWGPWEKRGMVSQELLQAFAQRGVTLVQPEVGRRMLDEELRAGRKGEAEIVVAGSFDDGAPAAGIPASFPLLRGLPLVRERDSIAIAYTLDPGRDEVLNNHRLDGNAVLPAVEAMNLMAELAQRMWPALQVVRLRDIRVQRGIVLKSGTETVRIVARPTTSAPGGNKVVEVQITDTTPHQRPYYRALAELAEQLPPAPLYKPAFTTALRPFPESVEQANAKYLFQGPALQSIESIEGINEEGIVGLVRSTTPAEMLSGRPPGAWLIDPGMIEGGFQMAIIWVRTLHDLTPLAAGFAGVHRFDGNPAGAIRCYQYSKADPARQLMHTDLYFVGPDGRVLYIVEDALSTLSRALNRLAQTGQR